MESEFEEDPPIRKEDLVAYDEDDFCFAEGRRQAKIHMSRTWHQQIYYHAPHVMGKKYYALYLESTAYKHKTLCNWLWITISFSPDTGRDTLNEIDQKLYQMQKRTWVYNDEGGPAWAAGWEYYGKHDNHPHYHALYMLDTAKRYAHDTVVKQFKTQMKKYCKDNYIDYCWIEIEDAGTKLKYLKKSYDEERSIEWRQSMRLPPDPYQGKARIMDLLYAPPKRAKKSKKVKIEKK